MAVTGRIGGTFRIFVQLRDIAPAIWRRVDVPGDVTLRELHAVFQGALGWQDYHLHAFDIDGRRFAIPESDKVGSSDGYEDERRVRMADVLSVGNRAGYLYDFGDSWMHDFEIEKWLPDSIDVPRCVDGERACPPEDCGGTDGYTRLLKEPSKNRHRDDEETTARPPGFNPGVFNIVQANSLVLAMAALYGARGWGFPER